MPDHVIVTLPSDLAARLKKRAEAAGASEATIIGHALDALDCADREFAVWAETVGEARRARFEVDPPSAKSAEDVFDTVIANLKARAGA